VSAIFGVLNIQQRPVEQSHLALMDEALRACGPDGAQLWHDGAVGLGQRWFQTTPAAHLERQPQMGPGQTCVLVADARLDNRMELGAHFGIAPAALSNVPDSALILMAYEKWGEACPEHLLGDFAFAL
jgi:asparagine synthase (glutamine-hydrolysing)